jgi:hypothetical protein
VTDRHLISTLLDGGFLCKRQSRDKRFTYAVYKGNMTVVASVTNKQYRRFIGLFKENNDRLTLNLRSVRSLHGKSLAKQLYKKSKSLITKTNAA